MKPNYDTRFVTHVPTCALIEEYHTLLQAIKDGDWDLVHCAMDCIAEDIDRHTEVPEGSNVTPSPSSIIDMSMENGIFTNGDDDIRCATGHPVSNAMLGGVCQCDRQRPNPLDCEHFGVSCFPEKLEIRLLARCAYSPASPLDKRWNTVSLLRSAHERGKDI